MSRYAVLDEAGQVVNLIEYDGKAEFDPGPGLRIRRARPDDALERRASDSPPRLDPTTVADLRAKLAAAGTVAGLKAAVGSLLDAIAPPEVP